jgi:divalent metal cation (Fe/Co/Zn/Cd) transporter
VTPSLTVQEVKGINQHLERHIEQRAPEAKVFIQTEPATGRRHDAN